MAIDERRFGQAESLLRDDKELFPTRAGQMALGYLYAHTGRYNEAREVFRNLREQHRGDAWEHIALHQLGRVERLAGQHEAALGFYSEEIGLIRKLDSQSHELAVNALERSISLRALHRLDEARAALHDCLGYAGQDDPETLGRAERELGELSLIEGHPEAAKLHLERAIVAFRESEDDFAVREIEARIREL